MSTMKLVIGIGEDEDEDDWTLDFDDAYRLWEALNEIFGERDVDDDDKTSDAFEDFLEKLKEVEPTPPGPTPWPYGPMPTPWQNHPYPPWQPWPQGCPIVWCSSE